AAHRLPPIARGTFHNSRKCAISDLRFLFLPMSLALLHLSTAIVAVTGKQDEFRGCKSQLVAHIAHKLANFGQAKAISREAFQAIISSACWVRSVSCHSCLLPVTCQPA